MTFLVQVFTTKTNCLGDAFVTAKDEADARRQAKRQFPQGRRFYVTQID